jgi:NIMA (never in mitosis gene a)-related kinase
MSEQERKETLQEAKILEVLNHPNIVRFREVYKTKKGKLCIVMDYADGNYLLTRCRRGPLEQGEREAQKEGDHRNS